MSLYDFSNDEYTFIIGNGINLLNNKKNKSWLSILNSLEPNFSEDYVEGYPLPEFFDLLALNGNKGDDKKYRDKFIEEAIKMRGSEKHRELYKFCSKNKIDVLTSNFDHSIQKINKLEKGQDRSLKEGFTNHYPWQRFYVGIDENGNEEGARIYHINGDIGYKRSIKISVKDYAGNINYFNDNFNPLDFGTKYYNDRTWINSLFEKAIVIAGLKLGEEEFFLRNMLIQRRAFRMKMKNKNKSEKESYYLYCKKDFSELDLKRNKLFFNSVGIIMKEYSDYESIYEI